uniref:Uncharacterized protein n=1 Tax=Oryza sativa subsp. japonica TaxID=39947 RepID=Q2QUC0_ORYSJ|nr:hypothetical protein LOC_Os12g16770 [Oryza sativa Japonica Group]
MVGYFNFSDEASEICRQFLTNIKNAQSNYISMGCFLATISDSVAATDGAVATTAAPPPSCGATRSATRSSFRRVHDMYSSILRGIKSSHRKVARKLKVVRAIRKISQECLVVACGAAAAASVALAAHRLFFGLLVGCPTRSSQPHSGRRHSSPPLRLERGRERMREKGNEDDRVAVGERREERGSGVGGEEEAGAPAARAERRGRRRHGGAAREDGRRGGERGARRQGKEGCRGRCSERPASARPFPAGRRSEGGQGASGGWGRRSGGWGRR